MAMAVKPVIGGPADKDHPGNNANGACVENQPHGDHQGRHKPDRQRMTERHRRQRQQNHPATMAVQAQCYGEQPSHCWIEPVKHTKSSEG